MTQKRDINMIERCRVTDEMTEAALDALGWAKNSKENIWTIRTALAAAFSVSVDGKRLDWLEHAAKKSQTGISFDWVPKYEDNPSGFRFMRRFFISGAKNTVRDAIDDARNHPDFQKEAAEV